MSQPTFFGLSAVGKGDAIPLKAVTVDARIQGYLVGVAASLSYANDGEEPLEVVFRFPVPDSWAVVGLDAAIAGRSVRGVVREKEEARQMYDDAIASGFSAAIGEEKASDIFSISLGNLPPKETAEIRLSMSRELPIDAEGGVRFTLPTVLIPRYTPAGSTNPLAAVGTGAEGGQTTSASLSPSAFSLLLSVEGEGGVSGVESPTHQLSCSREGGCVQGRLEEALDRDLVVLVHYKQPHQPTAIAEPAREGEEGFMGRHAVMLNFSPKFDTEVTQVEAEIVFLIDRSGSMQGIVIDSARAALTLFLQSLSPGCYFNVLGFGSRYESLFPKSVPYNQENLNKAIAHAESLQADLGGTELLSPLQYIFKQELLRGLPRQVFVLTDGAVSNTAACIAEVKKNVKHTRCFTFGIGSGASTALVNGLAKAGNGTAEFIQHGERMQPKVIRSLKRAQQLYCTDVQVTYELPQGVELVRQIPDDLPTIFNGDKFITYGIFKNRSDAGMISGTATLSYKVSDRLMQHSLPFLFSAGSSSEDGALPMPMVHQLAAKSLIQDLQKGEGLRAPGGADQLKKQEIIKLSIESSVVSLFTAYIAIQDQGEPVEGALQTWDVSSLLMQHKMLSQFALDQERFVPCYDSYSIASTQRAACCGGGGGGGGRGRSSSRPPPSQSSPTPVRIPEQPKPKTDNTSRLSDATPTQKMSALIALQQADGSWMLGAALASILGKTLSDLEGACPQGCVGERGAVWATLLAVQFLEDKLSSRKEEWELVAGKAEAWLRSRMPTAELVQLRETAKQTL